MLRDAYCNRIVASKGIDQQAYRPAVVYINGEYWGILNIREKVNEEFIAANHGTDEDIIDILERDGEVVRGSADHYEAMLAYIDENDISDDTHYDYLKTQKDFETYKKILLQNILLDSHLRH